MKRLDLSALSLGLLVGAVPLLASFARSRPQAAPASPSPTGEAATFSVARNGWPPAPSEIVSFSERLDSLGLALGAEHVLYQVPAGRYLVLTDIALKRSSGSSDATLLSLRERRANGTLHRKLGRGLITSGWDPVASGSTGWHSSLGVVFRPGSHVVLYHSTSGTTPINDIRVEAFVGYLTTP